MIYRRALRPLLFLQDAETAHERVLNLLSAASGFSLRPHKYPFTHPALKIHLAGIDFPNPVGLAAGCDKDGKAIPFWPLCGFGYVEIGTITAEPQPGNPRPRVFRLPDNLAVVNRLGFNSEGSEAVARRLAALRRQSNGITLPLGINIGKTRQVSGDEAILNDYRDSFRRLSRMADYVAINVSSPNTPGLRQWQERDKLTSLLGMLKAEAHGLAAKRGSVPTPLFLKISPDMIDEDMANVVEVAVEQELAGIIATNTTIAREGELTDVLQTGGLSGRPLRKRANEVIRFLSRQLKGRMPLIGVGGIFTAEDAYERIRSGASLVQLYTGLIYQGPNLPHEINKGLLKLMQRDGIKNISELVGVDA